MNNIVCPNCKKAFTVDEASFADILKQVRDHQFEEEIANRLTLAENEKNSAVQLAEANIKNFFQEKIAAKDNQLIELKAKSDANLAGKLADKEKQIASMESKIQNAETEKKLEVSEATKKIEKERDDLANDLKIKKTEKELLEKSIKEQFANQLIVKDDAIKMKNEK